MWTVVPTLRLIRMLTMMDFEFSSNSTEGEKYVCSKMTRSKTFTSSLSRAPCELQPCGIQH